MFHAGNYLNDVWFYIGGKCGCFILINKLFFWGESASLMVNPTLLSIWVPCSKSQNPVEQLRLILASADDNVLARHRAGHFKFSFLILETIWEVTEPSRGECGRNIINIQVELWRGLPRIRTYAPSSLMTHPPPSLSLTDGRTDRHVTIASLSFALILCLKCER